MFVQIIEGKTSDAERLHQRLETWQKDLMPGAVGFLGSTSGVAADGTFIAVARFQSADAAARNSARPEQDAWWRATEALFDGPVTFHDTEDTDTFLAGGSDTAGFVQVMQGRARDRAAMRLREEAVNDQLEEYRPDLIGSIRAWYDGTNFTEVAYFTSEAEARIGEAKEMPPDMKAGFEQWMANIDGGMRYVDLPDPWLVSA